MAEYHQNILGALAEGVKERAAQLKEKSKLFLTKQFVVGVRKERTDIDRINAMNVDENTKKAMIALLPKTAPAATIVEAAQEEVAEVVESIKIDASNVDDLFPSDGSSESEGNAQ